MKLSYNLVDQPFIPCTLLDGKYAELGLRETLLRAHEIREVRDTSPLVTVSLHRLLLAILHRNYGPASLDNWAALWELGRWDEEPLNNYFETWRARFDLCDPKRPFYQSPDLTDGEMHPICRLIFVQGNKQALFDHRMDARPDLVDPAEAARWLIAFQNFALGLGVSKPFSFKDGPLTRGLSVLVCGRNLFETLAANLAVTYGDDEPIANTREDEPAWESSSPRDPQEDGNACKGYLDYLTWQSRRVLLIPCDTGPPLRFVHCRILQNMVVPKSVILDPTKCYRRDEKRGLVSIGISAERAVWRDSHALMQIRASANTDIISPKAPGRLAEARAMGVTLPKRFDLAVFGLATEVGKAANIELWKHETLPLLDSYLGTPELITKVGECVNHAEQVERFLRIALAAVAKGMANGRDDPFIKAQLIESGARVYWSQLEHPFRELLVDLPGDADHQAETLVSWIQQLARSSREAFQDATAGLGTSTRSLQAIVTGQSSLGRKLSSILKEYKEAINEPATN